MTYRILFRQFTIGKHYLLVLILLLGMGSCTNKKSTWVTRTFHNTTSRFNAYHYARVSLKETQQKLEANHKEDYNKILPLLIYPTPEEAKGLFTEMDKNVKRLSKDIHFHTITKGKKEIPGACKWIDHCYILMGRSYFNKRDFFAALESFDYVSRTYKKSPSRFMGMMWMIRCYDELGSVSESESLIDLLAAEKKLPDEYRAEFDAIEAMHYLEMGNYGGAIKPLEDLINKCKSNKYFLRYWLDYGWPLEEQLTAHRRNVIRGRALFIEAQIEEKTGKPKKAAALYSNVIALNPTDDLTFNAQMARANCFDPASPLAEDMKKSLLRMTRDIHYADRYDQIYYALGTMSQKENDLPTCIKYLKKSLRTSVSNKMQQALTHLKLADIHYEKLDYVVAQAYYDSTVNLIKSDFPNYDNIVMKKKTLSELVKNIMVVRDQDSLQALAKLSDTARRAKVEAVIAQEEELEKRKEEERQAKFLQAQSVTNIMQSAAAPGSGNTNNGQWYFWNAVTMASGAKDFFKKWGDRKLEDNWRRSSKDIILDDPSASLPGPAQPTDAAADSLAKKPKDTKDAKKKVEKKIEEYLRNIPLTSLALAKSNEKIEDALYNIGGIYKEKLSNNPKSADDFEELLQRYPESKYKLNTYYQLYRLYLAMNKPALAEKYKAIILNGYPETEYAKIILNPGYNANKQSSLNEAEKLYQEVFKIYAAGKYDSALAKCIVADTMLGKSPLLSKFDMVKALCIGHTQSVAAFESALTRIIIKYPKEPIREKAQEYIDLIHKRNGVGQKNVAKKDTLTKATPYVFNKDANFYFMLYYDGALDANKYKVLVSNINAEYYANDNLTVEGPLLDATKQLLLVKSFQGKEKAMTYYSLLAKDKKETFKDLDQSKIKYFMISAENYPMFYRAKNASEYEAFFEANMNK